MKSIWNRKTGAMLWTHPLNLTLSRETLAEGGREREVRAAVFLAPGIGQHPPHDFG